MRPLGLNQQSWMRVGGEGRSAGPETGEKARGGGGGGGVRRRAGLIVGLSRGRHCAAFTTGTAFRAGVKTAQWRSVYSLRE